VASNEYGVIFDMDGVLIDSSEAHFESWKRLGRDLGVDVTVDRFRATFGRQNRDVIPALFGDRFTAEEIDAYAERKEAYYRELVQGAVPALDGAVDLIRECHGFGMKLAIGSSGHPKNIAMTLEALEVATLFGCVVSGHNVTIGKPHPQVFQLAADGLGLAPSRCAVIEDAPAGVEAALAAGAKAIAVTTEHAAEKLAEAHHIAAGPHELTARQIAGIIDAR
jgi:beta-phosphoglucomutase